MEDVLMKMREMNQLLQSGDWNVTFPSAGEEESAQLPLNRLAVSLGNILDADIYLINQMGVLRGLHEQHKVNTPRIKDMLDLQQFPDYYTQSVAEIKETKANIDVDSPQTIFPVEKKELYPDGLTTIIPIYVARERMGTLILGRIGSVFQDEDLILAEHAATVVGLEMLYSTHIKVEEESRNRQRAEMTLRSLSYSEIKAVSAVFSKLEGKEEGILTATSIADEIGITRSVVVNALRKLESGGMIESKSLGMKGTFIRILNQQFLSLLNTIQK